MFLEQNKDWLDITLTFDIAHNVAPRATADNALDCLNRSRGRPQKQFDQCTTQQKRRRIKHILEASTSQELSFATQVSLRAEGKRDAATVFKHVLSPSASPKRANKTKKRLATTDCLPIKMTKEKALAMYVDNKLTKDTYIDIQQTAKSHNANIFPPYNTLLEAKKACYPKDIEITEISGTIPLQSLVDHTINRLTVVLHDVLKSQRNTYDPNTLKVIFKWGCDGASGQSRYHQAFEDESHDDSCVFLIMLAPLRITAGEIILWQNATPFVTKYCRPLKIIFEKETSEFVKDEVEKVRQQITSLVPTEVVIDELSYSFTSVLAMTMIDGKTCSTLSNTANQNCHVCGATPKMMNSIDTVCARPTNVDAVQLGMSSLHAWIKCMECILHISYRLHIKKGPFKKKTKLQQT